MATDISNTAVVTASPESDADTHSGHHDGHGHGHDDHHPPFLAHHFDTPEQQFDSGKLGMWLFLVTEVLFFSGMFCAYAIFRSLRPDVFEGNSQFLNTKLGAINTGVLLFSSLTAAWAVRCSQTGEQKKLVAMLAATISCAMIFLGVKTIEYSHKWDIGLKAGSMYHYNPDLPHGPGGLGFRIPGTDTIISYLSGLCLPFALLLAVCVVWLVVAKLTGNQFQFDCAKPLTVGAACFFVGVGLGTVLESGESEHGDHGEHHAAAGHEGEHHDGEHHDGEHHDGAHANGDATMAVATTDATESTVSGGAESTVSGGAESTVSGGAESKAFGGADPNETLYNRLAGDDTNSGIQDELSARQKQQAIARGSLVDDPSQVKTGIVDVEAPVTTQRTAGVFFGIYYCMTGVHAIHILCGIGVMVWLLMRSVRGDFNAQYFGPVDYVGLYWHLVDLIWIYLFPLLYLIR